LNKRLERGSFQRPAFLEGQTKTEISIDELVMLLSGIDMQDIKRPGQIPGWLSRISASRCLQRL
jgi:hypothetical protein